MKEESKKKKSSRRDFLRIGAAVGIGSASLGGLLSSCSNKTGETLESGDTVKVLTPDGKLVEVDTAHLHHCKPVNSAEAREGIPGRKFVMVIDLAKCNNERKCVTSCQKAHNLSPGQEWIKVYLLREAEHSAYHWFPKPCFHCDNPICVSVCPVGATFKRTDGIVLIDNERCIGCKFCMTGCPYSTRTFNWKSPISQADIDPDNENYSPETSTPRKIGTVGKCDFCPDMVRQGELPHCVTACPMGTIYFGDINEDAVSNGTEILRFSELIKQRDGYRYAEELGTKPNVYYLSAKDRTYPVENGLENLSPEMKAHFKKQLDQG